MLLCRGNAVWETMQASIQLPQSLFSSLRASQSYLTDLLNHLVYLRFAAVLGKTCIQFHSKTGCGWPFPSHIFRIWLLTTLSPKLSAGYLLVSFHQWMQEYSITAVPIASFVAYTVLSPGSPNLIWDKNFAVTVLIHGLAYVCTSRLQAMKQQSQKNLFWRVLCALQRQTAFF